MNISEARNNVIAAALRYQADQMEIDNRGVEVVDDDARMELNEEILDTAIGQYTQVRIEELEALERGG